MDLQLRNRAR